MSKLAKALCLVSMACLSACLTPAALALSFCASDGVPAPTALTERFINAGCEGCWSDAATPRTTARELAVDWIVPNAQGDEAPLSAAATRDALLRLQALGRPLPAAADRVTHAVARSGARLRVAHGLPVNDYLGTSIELKPARGGPFSAWLLMVETVPAGTEGTPVERNLARNLLQLEWDARKPPAAGAVRRFFESRPMAMPAGANPKRMRVVGWVEDAKGRVVAAAQSRCKAD